MKTIALSLKQPWATLLVHGHKTVEVRAWPTPRRGPVLIHAARVPDPRPEAWKLLPAELQEHAKLGGGAGAVVAGKGGGAVGAPAPAAAGNAGTVNAPLQSGHFICCPAD